MFKPGQHAFKHTDERDDDEKTIENCGKSNQRHEDDVTNDGRPRLSVAFVCSTQEPGLLNLFG
jgi:hypothetical protein